MLTVTSPANSFIQFPATETDSECADALNLCLQVKELADLSFQIKIPKTAATAKPKVGTFLLRICPDCGDPVELGAPYEPGIFDAAVFTWNESLDGDFYIGTPSMNTGYSLELWFNPGECFNFCLYGPDTIKTVWTKPVTVPFPWPSSMVSFANGFSLGGTPTFNNLADIAAFLASAFPMCTFTVVGSTIVASSPTVSLLELGTMTIQTGEDIIPFPISGDYSGTEKYSCSNCMIYAPETCFTTLVKYCSGENNFGFDYNNDSGSGNDLASFYNQVRLSMFLKNPQIPTKKKVYRQSDGNYQKLSATMEKEYECEVDWLNEDWHTKLAVALEHDDVQFFNETTGEWEQMMNDESEKYEIDWAHNSRGTNFANAPANFKIKTMPFANFNNNC